MGAYVCPVCAGRGFVDAEFYLASSCLYPVNTTQQTTTCRSCHGKGVVFETVEYKPQEYRISDEEARNWIGYCTFGDFLKKHKDQ